MKYKTLAAVCALLLAAGMAGCGDSDSATQEPVSEEEAERQDSATGQKRTEQFPARRFWIPAKS